MKLAAYLAVLSVAAFSSAIADEPQSQASQPPAAPAAVQAPAPSAGSGASDVKPVDPKPADVNTAPPTTVAAPAAQADKTEAAAKAATDAEIKQMRGRGYKPVNRNGTLVFCRDEAEIGTHFQRTRCSTLDQLKQAELSGKEYVNSIQQQGGPVQNKP
jgi:hypothetical protein